MHQLRRPVLAISLALLVGACVPVGAGVPGSAAPGAAASPSPAPSITAAAAARIPIDELHFPGSLLICSDLPYPPQEFFDPLGNPIGSDIEIGEEIARRLGLEARIVNSLFETIIDALLAGKCDIVISAQNITPEREALVDMIPYFQAGQTFIVRRGNPAAIHNELDLCGQRVAVQRGTVQAQLVAGTGDYAGAGISTRCLGLRKPAVRLRTYDKDDEGVAALIAGGVDAYFTDSPAAGYHVVMNVEVLELSGLTLDVAVQGISVPRHYPALRDGVSRALASMMEDGTYAAILARYGVENGSVAGMSPP